MRRFIIVVVMCLLGFGIYAQTPDTTKVQEVNVALDTTYVKISLDNFPSPEYYHKLYEDLMRELEFIDKCLTITGDGMLRIQQIKLENRYGKTILRKE